MAVAFRWVGARLANYINQPIASYEPISNYLEHTQLQPCDVVLVENSFRISTAIKYLTQSTWSHAAICVDGDGEVLIEADVELGVVKVSKNKYYGLNTRVCRPVGLSEQEKLQVLQHVQDRLGHQYDLKNVLDLARYLWPMPLVPTSMRRGMLALGSGDPTKAICSTLIAESFAAVDFPILPPPPPGSCRGAGYTYICPRDFDVSPYFDIVKPHHHHQHRHHQQGEQGVM